MMRPLSVLLLISILIGCGSSESTQSPQSATPQDENSSETTVSNQPVANASNDHLENPDVPDAGLPTASSEPEVSGDTSNSGIASTTASAEPAEQPMLPEPAASKQSAIDLTAIKCFITNK